MFITIISAIALIVFLFSVDQSWSNVISSQRNDLVFEDRNQDYGAYSLRHEYHRNIFFALLISVGCIGGGLLAVSAMRSSIVSVKMPVLDDINIFVNANTIAQAEQKAKIPFKREEQKSSGMDNREVQIVDTQTKAVASSDERHDKQQGTGGDDDIVLLAPVGDGAGGDGSGTATVVEPKKNARRYVRNKPEFPGGDQGLMKYMNPRVKYNDREIDRHVEGTIYITFVVYEDGSVGEVNIERGILGGERLAKQAMEAILRMPRWTPGNDGQEPLPVIVTMPLKLELRN